MTLFLQPGDILENGHRREKQVKALGRSEVAGTAVWWEGLGREVVEGKVTAGLGQAG